MSNYSTDASENLHINGQEAQHQLEQLRKRAVDLQNAIAKAARTGNTMELKQLRKELRQTNREIKDIFLKNFLMTHDKHSLWECIQKNGA